MHILKPLIFSILIFVVALPCRAQLTVEGTVTDSLQNPIPNVNIYATGLDSVSIKAFDYSNNNGEFSLQLALNQRYLLHISSIGYRKKIINIPEYSVPDTLVKNLVLKEETTRLKELVVEAKRNPIITKEDTTIFWAESFMRGNEQTVEDILKQLPGIRVDSEGRIKANGKTISKVMIGGDDLFGYNYSLLTKNFTAKAIETVSVYEKYQENAVLKGISESHETVLDLALKDEFKVDFFGTATAWYDGGQNYELDGNLVSITPKFKGYLFENANNIGENPTGNVYNLLRTGSSSPFRSSSTLGENASAETFVNRGTYRVSQLDQELYLNNQTSLHALGGIYSPSDKLKIKGVGYFLPANRSISQQFRTRYDPSLNIPDLLRLEQTKKDIDGVLGNIDAEYTFSPKSNLKYEGELKIFPETDRSNRLFRNQPLQDRLESRERLWNQQLRFTHKITDTKAYRLRLRYKNELARQDLSINPVLAGGPFGNNNSPNALLQQSKAFNSYLGADITYWLRNSRSLFSVRAGSERSANSLQNRIEDQPEFTDSRLWDRYRTFSTLSYQYTIGKGLEAEAALTGILVWNRTNLQATVDEIIFYLNPEVSVTYEPNKKHELHLRYSYNQDEPGFSTLFGGRRLTSYQSIVQGTSDFTLLPTNSFTMSYRYGNWSDNFVMNTFFNYSQSPKSYTTATTITSTYNTGTYRLQRERRFITSRLEADQFLTFLQSNLAASYTFTNASFTSFFNNTANNIQSNSHQLSTYLRTAFVGAFNGSIGAEYNFSQSNNQTNNFSSKYYYLSGFANASLNFSDRWQLSGEYNLYQIEGAGDYHFLGASLQFDAIDDKLTLYLEGRNLLDQTAFETVSVGPYSRSLQRDALNPRFVLLGVKFSFR